MPNYMGKYFFLFKALCIWKLSEIEYQKLWLKSGLMKKIKIYF